MVLSTNIPSKVIIFLANSFFNIGEIRRCGGNPKSSFDPLIVAPAIEVLCPIAAVGHHKVTELLGLN